MQFIYTVWSNGKRLSRYFVDNPKDAELFAAAWSLEGQECTVEYYPAIGSTTPGKIWAKYKDGQKIDLQPVVYNPGGY
jgi:hypothetical protein